MRGDVSPVPPMWLRQCSNGVEIYPQYLLGFAFNLYSVAMPMNVVFVCAAGMAHVDRITSYSRRYIQQLYYKKEYTVTSPWKLNVQELSDFYFKQLNLSNILTLWCCYTHSTLLLYLLLINRICFCWRKIL